MNVKGWVKHIITKFGQREAWIFANSIYSCPCEALGLWCTRCNLPYKSKFYTLAGTHRCRASKDWTYLSEKKQDKIKKKINKRI